MAKTFTAPFAQTAKTGIAVCTAACTLLDQATNSVLLATAGNDGALVTKLSAMPRGTVTATGLLLFLTKSAAPGTYYLIDAELMPAATLAVTSLISETFFGNISEGTPLRLEAGDKLYVGAQVALAAGIVFKVEWMDY